MNIYDQFSEKHQDLLQKRARRVERAAQQVETRQLLEVLIIHLYSEKYAVPITEIQAVYEQIPVTYLPDVPSHIAGIANVRGQLVTVLDMARILEIPIPNADEQQTLVMLTYEDAYIALLVQKVGEVSNLPIEELTPVSGANAKHSSYLQGVLADGTVLLNLQQLLDDPALEVSQE